MAKKHLSLVVFAAVRTEGRTVIAVLHDLAHVRDHFDRTLLLAREPIAWGATADVLTAALLARARLGAQQWAFPQEIAA